MLWHALIVQRVAQLYGGSGLGLSISKELVRVMGGEMHVVSAEGKGSTFSFTTVHDSPAGEEFSMFRSKHSMEKRSLPLLIPQHQVERPIPKVVPNESPPKFRMIGVAEDNPINLQYLAKSLKKLGYQYALCTNGKELLERFCENGSTIDCCILDMSMPIMGMYSNGFFSPRLILR